MLICKDCNCLFIHPVVYKERHGLHEPPFETFYLCPRCQGEEWEQIEE